jgi:hypothetical protein
MKTFTKSAVLAATAFLLLVMACSKDDPATPTPGTPGNGTKSAAKDISAFTFAGISPAVVATVDGTEKTITATVPATADLTKLVPTITVSDKSSISPASGVAQDFSKAVAYTVTAEDGSKAVYTAAIKTAAAGVSVVFNDKLATISSTADMQGSYASMFAINSKIYYLVKSKANGGLDYKYFFEYDPATNKWTQKDDFSFKHNIGTFGDPASSTTFVHNGKGYMSNFNYTFFEFDPTTEKWSSSDFGLTNLSNDWTSFNNGILYGIIGGISSPYAFSVDVTAKTVKNYNMKSQVNNNTGQRMTFFVNDKLYTVTTGDRQGNETGKIEVYQVDFVNGAWVKKAALDVNIPNNESTRIVDNYLVDNKMYFISYKNIHVYDAGNDTWQTVSNSGYSSGGKIYATIGKTVYNMTSDFRFRSIQTL